MTIYSPGRLLRLPVKKMFKIFRDHYGAGVCFCSAKISSDSRGKKNAIWLRQLTEAIWKSKDDIAAPVAEASQCRRRFVVASGFLPRHARVRGGAEIRAAEVPALLSCHVMSCGPGRPHSPDSHDVMVMLLSCPTLNLTYNQSFRQDFSDYVKMFKTPEGAPVIHERVSDRWDVYFTLSERGIFYSSMTLVKIVFQSKNWIWCLSLKRCRRKELLFCCDWKKIRT